MTQSRVLPDDLLRDLVAVGEVDLLVGVPTLNHASTIEHVVRVVHAAFTTYFPRARTVLIVSDGGSTDGTTAIVRECSFHDAVTMSHSLRTTHRIAAPYYGLPGKANALHVLFAAADLLQARAVVVLDPDVSTLAPEWIGALAGPVGDRQFDFVAPVYPRPPLDGLLVTQLVRPLVRAAYGLRIQEPLIGEFGCSGGFAVHCTEHIDWDADLAHHGLNLWLTGTALAGEFRVAQAALGPRQLAGGHPRPGLSETFQQVVGSAFSCLTRQAESWLHSTGSTDVPVFGTLGERPPGSPVSDVNPMVQTFATDVHDLTPVLASIFSEGTLAALVAAATAPGGVLRFSDALWATTVYESLLAHQRGIMRREHITKALLPLYLGRLASFLQQHAESDSRDVDEALDSLCLAFELAKSHAVACWNQTDLKGTP